MLAAMKDSTRLNHPPAVVVPEDNRPLVAPILSSAVVGGLIPASAFAQEHVGQYAQRDIVAGSGIYLAQCGSGHRTTVGAQ